MLMEQYVRLSERGDTSDTERVVSPLLEGLMGDT